MKASLQICLWSLALMLNTACELPPRPNAADKGHTTTSPQPRQSAESDQTLGQVEEYIMVTTAINLPLYVNHDQSAFKAWGRKKGVKTSILGPSEWDVPTQIATIEQVIPLRPAGLLINGTDPGIAQAIRKAVAAGIPTVVYDSEIPNSQRHCFIGSDWYEMGRLQGERMAKLLKGKGKVAVMGILGMENMEAGFRGFQDAIKPYPGIEFLGKYDDKANVETAARLAADLIAAHPDIAGMAGFDSNSGPGIALAVKESNRIGRVKITTVDAEPEHLKLVKEGVIDYLVGQKRELFTALGAQFLYDMRHGTLKLSNNDAAAGVVPIPRTVITGSIEIDKKNVGAF
ncbi:MAG: substrate-binding domain-containing protein [Haliscomenobacter sp.]|uniref:substrate-binding domain-containing protein n=1 Tax=Haliscomenobacter sp. TaxID=2717303 RepID=UPI0029B293AB|nr:substrate-binding domain-containing protein [Haliscomenobacter sp.]MDX2071108.1 substrate-binding domain-containing protein [Haliscomenobacter sp.]